MGVGWRLFEPQMPITHSVRKPDRVLWFPPNFDVNVLEKCKSVSLVGPKGWNLIKSQKTKMCLKGANHVYLDYAECLGLT